MLGAVNNSVVNGKEEPIQLQVMDIKKCSDKLWLEATTNALYDAGVQNELLNVLYVENNVAKVAVKVNGKLTKRVVVTNVEMQGGVWGSLKCTTTMDQLNKSLLQDEELTYKYKVDDSIAIGVLGMVDDTLSISKCGNTTVKKNAVINYFVETQRLTLSQDKSVSIHIGRKQKCRQPCPKLKVHTGDMK